MLYDQHLAAPDNHHFEHSRFNTPHYSGRMDNIRAAMLRPQLSHLDKNGTRWNKRYAAFALALCGVQELVLLTRSLNEQFIGSSIQFRLPNVNSLQMQEFLELNTSDGVPIKWFGAPEPNGYTSRFDSWHYLDCQFDLSTIKYILATTCDIRIPLTFDIEDCYIIAEIIKNNIDKLLS